jgi:ABC-type multidrug transport system permease subunit
MNEPEISVAVPDELAGQISSLQRQVTMLLLMLVVVSSTLTAYLFYQSRILGKELNNTRPQAMQIIQNYNNNVPQMKKLIEQLVAYGQAHPDFQPILKKYGIVPATTNAAPKK